MEFMGLEDGDEHSIHWVGCKVRSFFPMNLGGSRFTVHGVLILILRFMVRVPVAKDPAASPEPNPVL